LITIGLIFAIIAPYPFPITNEVLVVESPDKNEKAIFYWRASGLMGVVSEDNPWVYLKVINKKTSMVREYNIWADTPCDGVERLKNNLGWVFEVCSDVKYAL